MSSGLANPSAVAAAKPSSSVPSLTDTDVLDLLRIERALLDAAMSAQRRVDALQAVLHLVSRLTNAITVVYSAREEKGRYVPVAHVRPRCSQKEARWLLTAVQSTAASACHRGIAEIKRLEGAEKLVAIAVPVALGEGNLEALSAIFLVDSEPIEPFLVILQLVVVSISLWGVQPPFASAEHDASSTQSLLELTEGLIESGERKRGAKLVADEVQARWGFSRVAIGLCKSRGRRCHVVAVSGLAQVDRRSELIDAIEPVMDEAVLRGKIVVWPASDQSTAGGTVSQKQLLSLCNAEFVISGPLRNREGAILGAWVLLSQEPLSSAPERLRQSAALEGPVGWGLGLLPRISHRLLRSAFETLGGSWSGWRGVVKAAAVLGVAGVLFVPWPYKVKCECVLQPVTRRFVAAPFDARLEEALVEPGDLVSRGQVLARLNGREIRWELAGLKADANRAKKLRDTSLAAHEVAESQMAALEMERLDLKTRLMEDRMENLEVKSPIDGLVIAGDLKKTEGMPVPIGRVLFEVAPLDKMVAEVSVPGDEISRTEVGQKVTIRLEAHASLALSGTLAKIHPRAEVRQGESVFVGEVLLDNPERLLRPGMIGQAKIVTAKHPVGWNLFHKAYERALCWLGE